jgi:hypothetical protein
MWLFFDFCCGSLQSLSLQRRSLITLGKLDDSPGLAVFLGMLDDKQLFLFQRF